MRKLKEPNVTGKGQRVGYVRVSTLDQQTHRQLDGEVLDRTFTDKASGKDTKRPQLEAMLAFVREGDTVVCHSMDRLGRNLDDLRKLVFGLTAKNVKVEFRKESLTMGPWLSKRSLWAKALMLNTTMPTEKTVNCTATVRTTELSDCIRSASWFSDLVFQESPTPTLSAT